MYAQYCGGVDPSGEVCVHLSDPQLYYVQANPYKETYW